MSLRSLFVISLADFKLLYHKVFPTVEKRWIKEHTTSKSLPTGQDLVDSLLTELGLFHSTDFNVLRDSCLKKLEAPLFWIPYNSEPDSYWPVVIVECQNRLLCSVPFLKQFRSGNSKTLVESSDELTIVLTLISKLIPIVNLPIVQMNTQLANVIQQSLPYGRSNGSMSELKTSIKPVSSQKGIWKRSKPKLEVLIKEEIRVLISRVSTTNAELYGAVNLVSDQEGDLNHTKLKLVFNKLSKPVSVLFHSSAAVTSSEQNTFFVSAEQDYGHEKNIVLCHYSVPLDNIPLQAVFKTKTSGLNTSISIQLKIDPPLRSILTRLEVRVPMPVGNQISGISTAPNTIIGAVSIQKDDTQLSWNLTPLLSTNRLKDEVAMNVDIETIRPLSLVNVQAVIMFVAMGSTLSGAQVSLAQQSDLKLVPSHELRSASYRVWNYDCNDII